MRFSEVIGQDELKKKLIRTVNENRVSHAQLFFGPNGYGSLPIALAYAQYINCTNRQIDDSCGECPSCRKYAKYIHPDLHFVFPVASSSIKKPVSDDFMDAWRDKITANPYFTPSQWYASIDLENKQGLIGERESQEIIRKLSMKSYEAEFKVMIIWQPDKMNLYTANKLLKIIEEPPSKTLFLLVAEDTSSILPTILSRTQLVKLSPLNDTAIEAAIQQESPGITTDKLENIIRLARGNYLEARHYLHTSEDEQMYFTRFTKLMRSSYKRDWDEVYRWVEELAALGREKQKEFFDYALRMVRENFVMNMNASETVRLAEYESSFSERFHPYINLGNAEEISNELSKAQADIERNAYGKLVFLDLIIKIVRLIRS
ncbi:MAG: ATP-binding protein [Bacteroidota bacterium]